MMALKNIFLETLLAASLMLCYASAQGPTTPENNGCQNMTCPANQVCRLIEVQCIRAPCYPVPSCVDSTPVCDPDPCAGLICLYGKARDQNGCIMCGCIEPCYGVTCSDGYSCEPTKNTTTNTYYGHCVPTVTRPPCAIYKCSANCSLGYKLDDDGCQMGCQCYDPCERIDCPANQRCIMPANDCPEGAECRDAPMPRCTDISELPTTPSVDRNTPVCYPEYCTLNCSNGRVKDEHGCLRCQCRVCDPDPCTGMICFYGKARDTDGCIMCGCNEPCFGFNCPEGQECQPTRNTTTGTYVGQCVVKVTRQPCQTVTCSAAVNCRFGYQNDRNGCRTCECYDPCQDRNCPEGQHCVMSADDCPAGEECRDGPMPYCVDSSATTQSPAPQMSTTNARGERGDGQDTLLQCCNSAGMSESCLSVCSTNITLLYSNLETLSGCFQYLGAFLHCASGGRSHMTCCNQRGISESCLYLCSGNDTFDMSNPHAITQCVISSSQTVLSCFDEGLTDANMTVLSTSTPSSTTAEDVCSLPAETGRCRGGFVVWYYSPMHRACSTFTYGGCGGNGNNFQTRDECLARCSRSGSVCPDVQCNSSCQITVDQYGCHTCTCDTDCWTTGCPDDQECRMVPGSCPNGTNCPLAPACIGKPDIICENMPNCTLSCPRGWMTDNTTGCPICQCKACPSACAGMICFYGRVKGRDGCDTCECYDPCQTLGCPDRCQVMRNNATGMYYGECYSASTRAPNPISQSPKSSLCFDAPDYGLSCQSNSTRWFYNQSANACSSFTFGGCQGNNNNFQTKPICEALCKDSACPELDCRSVQNCPYGLKTDNDGCSVCQCLDPCEGFQCPGTTRCLSRKSDCADSEACRDPFTRTCIEPSPYLSSTTDEPRTTAASGDCPPTCRMYCIHGFEKDSKGCEICTCRDPCKNCTANETCLQMAIDCPMNDERCANSFIGYCVPKELTTSSLAPTSAAAVASSTTAPHPCLLCMMRCPYLMLKKPDGCPVCRCYEPCEGINCTANSACQVFESDCSTDSNCPPNVRFRGVCVETTTTVPTAPSTTSSMSCPPRPLCPQICPYGNGKDANGCYTCDCDDPCLRMTCNSTQTCEREAAPGDCEGDMCWISYKAVCKPKCTRQISCNSMNCTYGLAKGADGCDVCQCLDPCQSVTCAANEECAVTMSVPPTGFCTVRCPSMRECKMSCEFGYVKDSAGCKICQCYDPCQNHTCSNGETCVPDKSLLYTGFIPERVYLSRCTMCRETMTCRMACPYGLAKNLTTECDMCQCYQPCQNVPCPSTQDCRPKEQFNGRYQYVPECADPTTTVPTQVSTKSGTNGPSTTGPAICGPVCSMFCEFGNVRDARGCPLCRCNANPCANVSCRTYQKCVASPFENGSYYAQCMDCPMPMCMGPCFYGTQPDVYGCPSCNCRMDPCAAVRCRDAACQTRLFCPESSGLCTPTAVCVDRIRPCDGLQKAYQSTFENNLDKMPQLNCDSLGGFKPIQCSEYDCWCVDASGNPTTNRSSMQINCYPGNQTKETLRMEADFNVIQPGDGWRFKQQVSQQLSNLLGIDESLVTVRKYVRGSIVADVVIGSVENTDMMSVKEKLNMAKQESFSIAYDNQTYQAILLGGSMTAATSPPATPESTVGPLLSTPEPTVGPQRTSSSVGPTPSATGSAEGSVLMIILVCVFVPIGFVVIAITIWFACKLCKNQRVIPPRRLSEKSGASKEFDSLESGSDKSYPSEKTASTITKSEKPVLDTTEA